MRFRYSVVGAFLLLGILLLAGCGGGSNSIATGTVQGYVYLSATKDISTANTGTPAAGVEARLLGTSFSALTDARGFFSIGNIPGGAYTMLISGTGCQGISLSLQIQAGQTVDIATSTPVPVARKWTVLVYMNANNDLESYALLNMNQLETAANNDKVTTVVQMARSPGYSTADGDWSGARRYVVQQDALPNAITSPVLQDMGGVDMGQPATLRAFIAWGQQAFPAEHYLVVVWDHGSGVLPFSYDSSLARGVSFDSTYNSYIKTVDLDDALTATPPVDAIAFDTCEMQMAEIAYQIRNACSYVIGSEGDTPATGYPYHLWLGKLTSNPDMSPRDLALAIQQSMKTYYASSSGIEQAVIDTSQLAGLTTAIDGFARALIATAGTAPAALATARDGAEHYAYTDYKDLRSFATRVQTAVPTGAMKTAVNAVTTALAKAVIAEYHSADHPGASGLSIYLPYQPVFLRNQTAYRALAFPQQTQWPDWLNAQQQ